MIRLVCCLLLLAVPVLASTDIVLSEAPREGPVMIDVSEEWSVGGPEADLMFGLMVEAMSDAEGNIYLMDQQLSQVTVVDVDGAVTGTLSREGEGPGEVRTPQGMMFMPDGTLALAQQFPGKLIRLHLDGTPADNVMIGTTGGREGGYTMVSSCTSVGDHLLVGGLFQAPTEGGQSRQSYLIAIDPQGQETVRFAQHDTHLDFSRAHFVEREMLAAFLGAHALDDAGRVYAARDRNSYLIDLFAADGTLLRTLGREFEPVPRDQREIDRMNELFEVQNERLSFDITWEVEKTEQTLAGLRVAEDGNLWVEHARSDQDLPAGVFKSYDVFSPEGQWLHRAQVRCPGDPVHDDLVFLGDGRVLLVRGMVLARLTASGSQGAVFDEDDVPEAQEVICYRILGN